MPEAIQELVLDPRLKVFRIKNSAGLSICHANECKRSTTDKVKCGFRVDSTVYRILLTSPVDLVQNWGTTEQNLVSCTQSTQDMMLCFELIFTRYSEDINFFLNLLRSGLWVNTGYNPKFIFELSTELLNSFYRFITQQLIHTQNYYSIKSKVNVFQATSPFTFIIPIQKQTPPGIYFTYNPDLDLAPSAKELKLRLFQPVLSYLTCMLNCCPSRNVSMHDFIVSNTKHMLHNHNVLDGEWIFSGLRQHPSIPDVLEDKLCNCELCEGHSW